MNPVEWCRKNDVWYLKIDLDIPEIIIKEAQAVYDEGFFVPHRLQDDQVPLPRAPEGSVDGHSRVRAPGDAVCRLRHASPRVEARWAAPEAYPVRVRPLPRDVAGFAS